MKPYIVATNSAYTILCLAEDEKSAVAKADEFYRKEYGESRNDWEAYNLQEYLSTEEIDIMPIRAWFD